MSREPPEAASRTGQTPGNAGVWTLSKDDAAFPQRLRQSRFSGATISGLGRQSLLASSCVGLVCSVQCPGNVMLKAFDAIRELRDAGIVVAGGFHSPMEQECLEFLLRGQQPVIVCPARHPAGMRLPVAWRSALDGGRLLVVSPLQSTARRTSAAHARTRNAFVAALSTTVLVPHASVGGKVEGTIQPLLQQGVPVFTFEVEENVNLLRQGARPYNRDRVLAALGDSLGGS